MEIILNGERCEVSATVLSDALAELGYGTARIATAVNGDFVPASGRARTTLADGDRVEVVAPQQGG